MSNVLGRMENAESESGQKIARRQETSDRSQSETGSAVQKIGHVPHLRNVSFSVSAVGLEHGKDTVEFLTGVRLVHSRQLVVNHVPRRDFGFCVGDQWQRLNVSKMTTNEKNG